MSEQPDAAVSAVDRLVPGAVTRVGLDRGGGRMLRWIQVGAGAPVIVLVAGAGETALDWLPVLPALAELSTVVALDRAGLGASDLDPAVTVQGQVGDLAAVLAEVGPAIIVGHSWGGLLAQLVALRDASAISGMVLVDSAHEDIYPALPLPLRVAERLMHRGIVMLRAVGLFERIALSMARRLAERSSTDPGIQAAIIDAYVASYRTHRQVAMIGIENRLAGSARREARSARRDSVLPDVPVVVLSAIQGKPDRLSATAVSVAGRVAKACPQGRHRVVTDAGHYIHHDQPSVVVGAVSDVLSQVRSTEI